MSYKIKVKRSNEEGIIILRGGGLEVTNLKLSDVTQGPILINMLKNLTAWMKKNIVNTIEIEEE